MTCSLVEAFSEHSILVVLTLERVPIAADVSVTLCNIERECAPIADPGT
jgi:hypothetical protein